MGVRRKLIGLVLLGLLPLVVLDAVQIYSRAHRRQQEDLQDSLEFAEAIGAAFDNYLEGLWTAELALGDMLAERGASRPDAEVVLREQLAHYSAVSNFTWLNQEGQVIAGTNPGTYSVPMADRPYIQGIMAGETTNISDVMQSRVTGEPIVTVNRGIRQAGRLRGIIVAVVDVRKLDSALPVQRTGSRSFGLADRQGMLVYRSSTPDLEWERRRLAATGPAQGALRGAKTVTAEYHSIVDDTTRMGAAVPIRAIGWAAFATSSVAEVQAMARADLQRGMAVLVLVVIASGAGVLLLERRIVRPILALRGAALAIAAGDRSARVQPTGEAELEATARTFNEMADRIQGSDAQLRTRAEQQSAVAALGQHALAGAPLPAVMDEGVQLLTELLHVEYCSVLELLPDGDAMLLRAASGWEAGLIGHVTFPADLTSHAGYSLIFHEPVIVTDLRQETRFGAHWLLLERGVTSGMTVIIHGTAGPYGVLAAHTTDRRTFTVDDIHFLQSVANVLGTAVQRSHAEEERAELLALEQVARADAEVERQRLYDLIMQSPALISILRGPDFVFDLINPPYRSFLHGYDPIGRKVAEVLPEAERLGGLALLERIYRTGYCYIATERPFQFTMPDGSTVDGYLDINMQPLRNVEGEIEGILTFLIDVTEGVRARQSVEALAADMRILARQQAAVAELGRLALEITGSVLPWLDEMSRVVAGTLEVECCSLLELMSDLNTLVLRAGTGWPAGAIGHWRSVIDVATQAAQAMRAEGPLAVADLRARPDLWIPPELAERGVVSAVSVVIQGQTRSLGVLSVHATRPRTFTEEDVNFLQAVAHLAATAIEQTAHSRRMAAQHTVSQLLAGASGFAEAIPELLQAVGQGLWWEMGALWQVDRNSGEFVRSNVWLDPTVPEPDRAALALDSGQRPGWGMLCGGQSAEPRWIADLATDELAPRQEALLAAGFRAAVWVPITMGSEVLGAVAFYGRLARIRNDDTLQVLATVASQIGQFIERIRAEADLRTLNAELEVRVHERTGELAAANMELEAFTSSVSHDLRAPLRTIAGFGQALAEDCGAALDANGQDHLRRIREASHRMAQLIDDLLLLSRVTRAGMRREPVDLTALALLVTDQLMTAEPGREGVRFNIEHGLKAYGDERLLRVALENLLGNAWKFTAGKAQATISFGCMQHVGKPAYYVRDDGAGFDMAYADKLFAPFQRLHSNAEFDGSGIGLATVKRVILKHGGQVWGEGVTGGGATFYFTL